MLRVEAHPDIGGATEQADMRRSAVTSKAECLSTRQTTEARASQGALIGQSCRRTSPAHGKCSTRQRSLAPVEQARSKR